MPATKALEAGRETVKGPGDKKDDIGTIVGSTAAGAGIGTGIGAAAGHNRRRQLIGLGGGAAAGLIGVLLTRGPDATLLRGSTVEMVLDRALNIQRGRSGFQQCAPGQITRGGRRAQPQKNNNLSPQLSVLASRPAIPTFGNRSVIAFTEPPRQQAVPRCPPCPT